MSNTDECHCAVGREDLRIKVELQEKEIVELQQKV